MTYDPRACGAQCDVCPLRGHQVVPPELGREVTREALLRGDAIALVGEAPGENEERQARPFVGKSGEEMEKAIYKAGFRRTQTLVTNVLLCRPPKNRLKELLTKINRHNAAEQKRFKQEAAAARNGGPQPRPLQLIANPVDCCKPRLELEIANFTNFITLGKTATNAVTGATASILALRGGLMNLEATDTTPARKVMPTIHPAFAMRKPRWFHVFYSDVFKAGRWFRGEAAWRDPDTIWQPTPMQLREYLWARRGRILTADIETDGIECLDANIRCLAIGEPDSAVSISILSKDGVTRFYPMEVELEIRAVLKEFFEDPNWPKAGHNFGYYDKLCLRKRWGIECRGIIDTILLHRVVEPELPHSLGYVGSMYTEAPAWKTDREGSKLAVDAESDEELAAYCVKDVAVNARVIEPLVARASLREQVPVWQTDTRIQAVCADMHDVGMWVDQEERQATETKMLRRRFKLLTEIRERIGNPKFNPGSVYQVRDILFEKWQLEPPLEDADRLTNSDDPSTSDLVLRSLLSDASVQAEQREFIKLLRYFRKVQKVLGTYVVKLRPRGMTIEGDLGWDDDEDWVDRETRERYGLVKQGIVDPRTGRMHPGYNAHVAVTGRLSSSKPINAQNFPKVLRAMVRAQPGHVLVGADMDQLELRIAAARWGVQLYLRAFADGKDPHSMTAFAVFGEAFCRAAGLTADQFDRPGKLVGSSYIDGKFEGTGDDKKMRDLSKAVQYASQYMAAVETVAQLIRKTEVPAKDRKTGAKLDDGTTDLPYALMKLRRVREMRENWLLGAPEFKTGWEAEIAHFNQHKFVQEYVNGRKRDFLDTAQALDSKMTGVNEIVNFPIQASAAGLMNNAIIQLHDAIPLGKWGPGTGIINQCHDSIVIECPADGCHMVVDPKTGKKRMVVPPNSIPARVARLMEEAMNQTHPALPGVTFTATAAVGFTWKEVG